MCCGLKTFTRNDKSAFGKLDFVFVIRKVVFCDNEI